MLVQVQMESWHPVFPCHVQQDEQGSKDVQHPRWGAVAQHLCSCWELFPRDSTPAAANNTGSGMWICHPGLALSKLLSVSCSSGELLKQCADSSFLFFPPFYLKQWAFYRGRMRSILCIDLLFVCLIMTSSRIFWYKELRVWWDYPRNLLMSRQVNWRNFTVLVSWWYSHFFLVLKWYHPWIHFCESLSLDLLVGSEDWFLCIAPPCPFLAD